MKKRSFFTSIFAIFAMMLNGFAITSNFVDDDVEGIGRLVKQAGGGFKFIKDGKKPMTLQKSGFRPFNSSDPNREVFQNALEKYKTEGRFVTPGFLRVEQTIINGKMQYRFSVVKDSNSDTVTEVKLDRNDKFLITHIGLFLMKRLSTLTGLEVLQTYPNPVVFADNSTTFYGAHLETFYNGFISIKVGQTVFIEKLDTRQFRFVGAALEQTGASNYNGISKSSEDAQSGFISLTPQFELDGDGKTEITIEAPVHSTALVAHTVANTTNHLVLMARGFLAAKR